MTISCPKCKTKLSVRSEYCGQEVQCPCGCHFIVPEVPIWKMMCIIIFVPFLIILFVAFWNNFSSQKKQQSNIAIPTEQGKPRPTHYDIPTDVKLRSYPSDSFSIDRKKMKKSGKFRYFVSQELGNHYIVFSFPQSLLETGCVLKEDSDSPQNIMTVYAGKKERSIKYDILPEQSKHTFFELTIETYEPEKKRLILSYKTRLYNPEREEFVYYESNRLLICASNYDELMKVDGK